MLRPGEAERHRLPRRLLRPIAKLRGRIKTTVAQLTEQLGLARHKAKSFWGLLARTAATSLAHTIITPAWSNSHNAPEALRLKPAAPRPSRVGASTAADAPTREGPGPAQGGAPRTR